MSELLLAKLFLMTLLLRMWKKMVFRDIAVLDVWVIFKALEKIPVASKCIVFTDSLSCLQALQSMMLEHPVIGMVMSFLILTIKTLFLLGT